MRTKDLKVSYTIKDDNLIVNIEQQDDMDIRKDECDSEVLRFEASNGLEIASDDIPAIYDVWYYGMSDKEYPMPTSFYIRGNSTDHDIKDVSTFKVKDVHHATKVINHIQNAIDEFNKNGGFGEKKEEERIPLKVKFTIEGNIIGGEIISQDKRDIKNVHIEKCHNRYNAKNGVEIVSMTKPALFINHLNDGNDYMRLYIRGTDKACEIIPFVVPKDYKYRFRITVNININLTQFYKLELYLYQYDEYTTLSNNNNISELYNHIKQIYDNQKNDYIKQQINKIINNE